MKTKHTPTPWHYDGRGKIQTTIGNNLVSINGYNSGVGQENAEFIVRAVNSHDELMEIILAALPYVEEGESFNKITRKTLSKRIRAILESDPIS